MTNGIRSYGPGKFHTIIDSHAYEMALDGIDEEISIEDGGGWYGFMMLGADGAERIKEIAEEAKEPLTEDEENFLRQQAAVIFFERSDGIVEATWYNDELAAKQDWEEIENEFEEDEDEGTLETTRYVKSRKQPSLPGFPDIPEKGDEDEDEEEDDEEPEEPEEDDDSFSDESMAEGYVISDARGGGFDVVHEHKHVGHYRSMENALEEIAVYMEQEKFFPNTYYVNDHGNVDLLDENGNTIESRV